jgi:hypothetical protein
MKTIYKFLERLFLESWWVILFIIGSFCYYEQGLSKKEKDFAKLNLQLSELKRDYQKAKKVHDDLERQINSQSDPSYVELTLMESLGLVPEGEKKVLFIQK